MRLPEDMTRLHHLGLEPRTVTALERWLSRGTRLAEAPVGDLAEVLALLRRALREARPQEEQGRRSLEELARMAERLGEDFRSRVFPLTLSVETQVESQVRFLRTLAEKVAGSLQPRPREALPQQARWALRMGGRRLGKELLLPQRAFNLELVSLLDRLGAPATRPEQGPLPEALARLRRRANPADWELRTHRSGLRGRVVRGLRRAWLWAAEPLVAQVLERQRRWNEDMAALIGPLLEKSALPTAAALEALAGQGALLEAGPGTQPWEPLLARALEAVFQPQSAFNAQAVQILRAWALQHQAPVSYETWYAQRERQRHPQLLPALERLVQRPLLSIVTPTYETPEPLLRACIESVQAQSYPHWELCLADDGSRSPHVVALLEEYARRDARIRFVKLESNVGIAAATNAALALARGEWVGFLDHDDLLAPHALAEVALRLQAEPSVDVLYSDEDKMDVEGRRNSPTLKPDWSPELLRTTNYLCHFLVVRRSLLEQAGGIRQGVEGSQDYDLILRLSERTQRFAHIPEILYHWRAVPTSTAAASSAKPAASDAGQRSLAEHLERCGEQARVETLMPSVYRVRYPVAADTTVSLVLAPPVGAELPLLEQLRTLPGLLPTEVVLVAEDAATRPVPELPATVKLRREPVKAGHSAWGRRNLGAREATGKVLLFASAGLRGRQPEWLQVLAAHARRPEVGAVGGRLLDADGHIREAGRVLGLRGSVGPAFEGLPSAHWVWSGNTEWTRNCSAVSAECLAIGRERFLELGGFDEHFQRWGADVVLCLRLRERGLRIVYAPEAEFSIAEPAESPGADDLWELFPWVRPWLQRGDPYYNPGLSLLRSDGRRLREHELEPELLACGVLAGTL